MEKQSVCVCLHVQINFNWLTKQTKKKVDAEVGDQRHLNRQHFCVNPQVFLPQTIRVHIFSWILAALMRRYRLMNS